jgi:hypothetical protein
LGDTLQWREVRTAELLCHPCRRVLRGVTDVTCDAGAEIIDSVDGSLGAYRGEIRMFD